MLFAIGVEELDFRYEKIFDLRFSRTLKFSKPRNKTETVRMDQVKLVPCTPQPWADLGLLQFYESYSMNQMLCPDPSEIMRLSEDRGYRLEIKKCSPEGTWPSSQSNYTSQMNSYFQGFTNNTEWMNYYQQQFDLNLRPNNSMYGGGDQWDFSYYPYQ
jgi:hypothetical protein